MGSHEYCLIKHRFLHNKILQNMRTEKYMSTFSSMEHHRQVIFVDNTAEVIN
jgi:hypothetical protein